MNAESQPTTYKRRNLYFSAVSVYTLFIGVGVVMSWASPAIPKLKEEHNFTASGNTLLVSIPNLAPGPLLTIFGIDTIGRKGTLFVIWMTTVISPIIMLISQNIYALLVARFIGGVGMGAAFSALGIYISEISVVELRGALNSVGLLFLSVGSLISYSVGPFVPFTIYTIVCLAVSSIFGILVYFLPESPYFNVAKNEIDKARRALVFLRGSENVNKELSEIQFSVEEEKKSKTGIKKMLTSKAVLKQFALSFYLLYLQQASGLGPLSSYSQDIFDNAKLKFDPAYVPIGLTILLNVVMIPSPFIVKRFGTKHLFMFGGFGSGFFMILFGVYFCLLYADYDLTSIKYAPIVLNFLANITFYVGLGGIVWGTVSDLFAPSVKGTATGICGIFSTLLGFVVLEIFGEVKDAHGYGPTFIGFGIVQFLVSFGILFITDTTKMTLQEIQDYYEDKTTNK